MNFFDFFRSSFYFFIVFFLLTLCIENGTKSTKNRFSSKSVIFSHFLGFKIASKDIVCKLKTHKVFVCTMSKIVLYVQFYFLRISSPNPFVTFKLFLVSFVLMECFVLLYVIRFFNFLGCNSVMVKILNLYLVYFFEVC